MTKKNQGDSKKCSRIAEQTWQHDSQTPNTVDSVVKFSEDVLILKRRKRDRRELRLTFRSIGLWVSK